MSTRSVRLFSGHLQRQGKTMAPLGNIMGARCDRDRPTTPPPALLSQELDQRADQLEAHIAQTQTTVAGLRRTAARLRGEW